MTQKYEKPVFIIEIKKVKLKGKKQKIKKKKKDKSEGISNPRYYEQAGSLKKVKDMRPLNSSTELFGYKF